MDLRIREKSFIVVGGSRGMGWEAARLLAEDGANIAIICRGPDQAAEGVRALADRCGVDIHLVGADVMVAGSVDRAIDAAIGRLGPIAGLAVTTFVRSQGAPFTESVDSEWNGFYEDILMGTVRSCRAIIPHMLENGGGSIVTTSAFSARSPKSHLFAYASLKAAVVDLTKNLAKTYGPQGIRANCVCPGAIETERSTARVDALVAAESLSRRDAERVLLERTMKMTTASERLGQPAEVGDMIAFLLSGRATYANGLIANIDGGTDF